MNYMAKTTLADGLNSNEVEKVRINTPVPPYRSPSAAGGYIVLVGYAGDPTSAECAAGDGCKGPTIINNHYYAGEPEKECKDDKPKGPCTCSSVKDTDPKCPVHNDAEHADMMAHVNNDAIHVKPIERFEIIKYSSVDENGNLCIEKRGAGGTSIQNWCIGATIIQDCTGLELLDIAAELKDLVECCANNIMTKEGDKYCRMVVIPAVPAVTNDAGEVVTEAVPESMAKKCFYDSDTVDKKFNCMDEKHSDFEIDDTKVFEHFFTTGVTSVEQLEPDEDDMPTRQNTPAVKVEDGSSINPFQYILNRDSSLLDWMPKCHNVLKVTLVSQVELNGKDDNDLSLDDVLHTGYANGGVNKKSGMDQDAESSTSENDKPIEVNVWFDSDGNITFDHDIKSFPDPALLEYGHAKFSVRMQGSAHSKYAPYQPEGCIC